MIIDEVLSLAFQTFLSGIFRAVLIMSVVGSVLALILFALNSVLTKLNVKMLSKAAQYRAWKIVLAVFFVPAFLSGIFRAVLIMSVVGSVLTLILFALNSVLTKLNVKTLSKAAQYRGWKIVLAVFFVPVFLLTSAPIRTPIAEVQNVLEETIVPNRERADEIAEKVDKIVMSVADEDTDAQQLNELRSQLDELRSQWWIDFLKFIPLGISAVLFGTTWIKYLLFSRKLRSTRLPARNEETVILRNLSPYKDAPALYRNPLVPTAMLVGVFDPTIYLPDYNYSETQLENILLHELTHYRRRDVLVKWFSALLTQLHWFNPVAHLVHREINRVCELSCDEAAIEGFDDQQKQEYGDTLISVAAGPKIPNSMISTALCEEKRNLKDRLTAIMNSKKLTRGTMVFSNIFVALTLCTTVVFAAAPNTGWIDRSSVTSAAQMASLDIDYSSPSMYESVPFASAFPDLYEDEVLSETEINRLILMINLYSKTLYTPGSVQPAAYRDNIWMQINCEDGGYYLLHYWYWNGFSFNPLHFGEDDYCSLLTYFDASGNIGKTWKMSYYFDGLFAGWARGAAWVRGRA